MKRNILWTLLLLLCYGGSEAQMIIPTKLISSVVGGSDNDIQTRIGILGSGSLYQNGSEGDLSNQTSAAGGFSFIHPFGTHVKEGKLNAFSLIFKYNLSSLRTFILRDSIYNYEEIAQQVSRQLFSFDNRNNWNLGLRYNLLKRTDKGSISILNVFGDLNITNYKIGVDSLSNVGNLPGGLKLSPGFSCFNPLAGVSFEWSSNIDDKSGIGQRVGLGLSLCGTAAFIYENEAGKNIIPSWAYTLTGANSFQENFSKVQSKINNFYAVFGKLYVFLNDLYFFVVFQKNFVDMPFGLEMQGLNNRNFFLNYGITFSPSLISFGF